jgi:hypothetical protein
MMSAAASPFFGCNSLNGSGRRERQTKSGGSCCWGAAPGSNGVNGKLSQRYRDGVFNAKRAQAI